MFEQAILQQRGRSWTLAASLTMQSAFAGGILLLSIWTIDRLPGVTLPVPLPSLPASPRPAEIVASERSAAAAFTSRALREKVFIAPSRIPDRVAVVIDDVNSAPPAGVVSGLTGTGLPPGLYTGTPLHHAEQEVVAPPPTPAEPPALIRAKPAKILHLGGNVLAGKLLRKVIPEYPALARQMRVAGTVRLTGIVATDGRVRDLSVIEGHPLLVQAAVQAVRQWIYQPTLLNGEPVEVTAPIEVHFRLDGR
jgi:protein TonB